MLTWGRGWGNAELVEDGVTVGHFASGFFRERTTALLPDGEWSYAKQFGGDIVATGPGGFQLVARKTSIWTYSWSVSTPAGVYEVKAGAFSSTFRVLRGGVQIGEARRAGMFTRRFALDVARDVPLQDQVFLLWVVEASERRRSSGAGASATV